MTDSLEVQIEEVVIREDGISCDIGDDATVVTLSANSQARLRLWTVLLPAAMPIKASTTS